ncbi:MAG TPA: hypothetical protein GXX51_05740 [Firmicutes bacterium]|nr:hypothetical protein [Bacillota bacterium]
MFRIPSCGDEIEVRKLKVKEQSLLVDRKRQRDGSALNEVLQSCILTPGYDVKELLVGDRLALLIHLRAVTYGSEFVFRVTCDCGESFMWKEDLSALPVKYLDPPLPYGEDRIIERVLPSLGKKIKVRLLKGKDEPRMRAIRNNENSLSGLLRLITVEVEGEKVLSAKWFDDLDADDMDYIIGEWRASDCGVDTTVQVECPACGRTQEMELPIGDPAFFMPKASKKSFLQAV